tara:strand:- start:287 stop:1654 length:1368 start_codon:yes stop_codon:yes gene_type:complete
MPQQNMSEYSIAPIAAIVDLLLGIVTIFLVRRSKKNDWMERMAGHLIGWILILKGIEYTFSAILEYTTVQSAVGVCGTSTTTGGCMSQNTSDFIHSSRYTVRAMSYLVVLSLCLIYPYPLIQRRWAIPAFSATLFILGLLIAPITIFSEYRHVDADRLLLIIPFLVLVHTYIRFSVKESKEENRDRTMPMVSGVLLIAFFGEAMVWWLSQIWTLNDSFIVHFSVIGWEYIQPSRLGWLGQNTVFTLSAISIMVLSIGEAWRSYKFGIGTFSIGVFFLATCGVISLVIDLMVMDVVDSCFETRCEMLPDAWDMWYRFTAGILTFLFTPLMLMYIIINFNIVDSQADENQWLARIMVILLLLIVSSSIIELLQSLLPIPQLISSAFLAIMVGIFIGWEQRIMSRMMSGGESVSNKLRSIGELREIDIPGGKFDQISFAIGLSLAFSLLMCVIDAAIV